ncbi:TRAP transporter substrate-binding protein [Aneurinibacillus tyrosinisolvens]|uniref:TRAP transporter substrate-binding protein n=1 Tax=Aneurinibacillus tyrosinisolvens TaxID=1443435 RepID=UPI000A4E1A76|nr:TRAP transporter substrate-binding protein [Aneurinibacillus tyrosinisolvens]
MREWEKATTAGSQGGQEKKQHTIKVANFFAADHPQNVALREKFKPMVEEKSGGTLKVEIFDNNKLGAEKEFYDGVRNGTIEMGISGMSMQSDVEKMQVPEWPFLFKDFNHVKKVLNGPIGQELAADLEPKHGVHPLAWSANGFRMFSSNRTIAKIEDFKGLRIRVPNVPNYITLGKLLGVNVTPMPISEVFPALEQKVVDGQENPIATLRASGWYEVQSDVLESQHMFSPNIYIINSKLWKSLTPEQQKVIEEASKTAADYEFDLLEKSYEADKKFLQEHKIKFTTPSDEFRSQMEQAAQPLYDEIFQKFGWAKEMRERIKAEAN